MDPQQNAAAVAARDSVASTLASAAERLAGDLHGRRCTARPLTGYELAEVDATVAAGLHPASTWLKWGHLKHFDGYATSFRVSPRDITSVEHSVAHTSWKVNSTYPPVDCALAVGTVHDEGRVSFDTSAAAGWRGQWYRDKRLVGLTQRPLEWVRNAVGTDRRQM